jgi:hypothetical protein
MPSCCPPPRGPCGARCDRRSPTGPHCPPGSGTRPAPVEGSQVSCFVSFKGRGGWLGSCRPCCCRVLMAVMGLHGVSVAERWEFRSKFAPWARCQSAVRAPRGLLRPCGGHRGGNTGCSRIGCGGVAPSRRRRARGETRSRGGPSPAGSRIAPPTWPRREGASEQRCRHAQPARFCLPAE